MGAVMTGPVPRIEGWEVRLVEAIEAARARPFVWGENDCATVVADVRKALTGDDMAAEWRGRYRTARGAMRLIRSMGHATLAEAVTARLGPPLPSVLMAGRGDVLLHPDGLAIGFCAGAHGLFPGPDGLVPVPFETCLKAWRV